MILKQLSVKNFRNYSDTNLSLSPGINIFYGNNAQGKTNLLESIYYLSFTKSHRSFIDNNLIKNGEKFLKITGIMKDNNIFDTKLEIFLNNEKKQIFIDDNLYKKVSEYISKLNIIIFYPEDLDIIKGSPNIRRRYINSEISQFDENYLVVLNNFRKVQKLRNDYLKKINSFYDYDNQYLSIINDYFIKQAILIYRLRYKFINKLNEIVPSIFFDLTKLNGFHIKYINNFNIENFDSISDQELIELFLEKFERNFDSEVKIKSSMFGPHKDDIEFYLDNLNLKNYGSQGQQRLAILSIKLASVEILKQIKNDTPILLLDDVFSELDDEKKNHLLKYIDNNIQTIITTTDLKSIDNSIKKKSKLFEIENGNIICEKMEVDDNE